MIFRKTVFVLLFLLLWCACDRGPSSAGSAETAAASSTKAGFPVSSVLTPAESELAATVREKSKAWGREHVVLVWPEEMPVSWYAESGVTGPDGLGGWLERCYRLCMDWLGIDPDKELNEGKEPGQKARLMFLHNGMGDYNFGGNLPRPVIGLRDLDGAGSEDWFGWLTHELSHEFLLRFPEVTGTAADNAWHEAFCDYLRFWLLKESGMPEAAARWLAVLKSASPQDQYRGGAALIMACHDRTGCKSPADLWKMIKGKSLSAVFGEAPWAKTPDAEDIPHPEGQTVLAFEAVVDGAGSFTFRDDKVYYEHFTWQYPSGVKIDGREWRDLDTPFELGFKPVFESARAAAGQGRNTMALIPHPDRLVLYIDDNEDSSSLYRLIIVLDKP